MVTNLFDSLNFLCTQERDTGIPFWKQIQREDCAEQGITEQDSFRKMADMYTAMLESDKNYDPNLESSSGLVGTDARKLDDRRTGTGLLCGDFIGRVMVRALRIAESNACMKRIVAAPTAGSCGVLPAVLITIQEEKQLAQEELVRALYVAGGIGGVIGTRASLAGASGGCQAEIGSASAMAAGAAVQLFGGSAEEICHAATLALKGLLGLACDPVAGLVEVPCVKRNVLGAVNALSCCDMALAGIRSRIPPDEVIDAMRSIGRKMDPSLRETGTGGLAATPTGQAIREKISMPKPPEYSSDR
jgi:L-serine dehydratase